MATIQIMEISPEDLQTYLLESLVGIIFKYLFFTFFVPIISVWLFKCIADYFKAAIHQISSIHRTLLRSHSSFVWFRYKFYHFFCRISQNLFLNVDLLICIFSANASCAIPLRCHHKPTSTKFINPFLVVPHSVFISQKNISVQYIIWCIVTRI